MVILMKMVRIFTMLLVLIGSVTTSYAITYEILLPLGDDGGRLTGFFDFGDDHIGYVGIEPAFLDDFHIFYYAAGVTDPSYEWIGATSSISGFQYLPWDAVAGDYERIGLAELHPDTGVLNVIGTGTPQYELYVIAYTTASNWFIFSNPDGATIEESISGGPLTYRTVVPEPATLLLLGTGLAGLVAFRRRFRNK